MFGHFLIFLCYLKPCEQPYFPSKFEPSHRGAKRCETIAQVGAFVALFGLHSSGFHRSNPMEGR